MSTSIPISELNLMTSVSSSDYVPIVQNISKTTFRTPMSTVGDWISSNVVCSSSISSSWASSSSFARQSMSSSYASNLIYPNTSTASYTISSSHSLISDTSSLSNKATSASWAPIPNTSLMASSSISASWASSSIWSISASFASGSTFSVSASWASQSLSSITSTSSSFASQSISSSYSVTASYVISSNAGSDTGIIYPYIQEINFLGTDFPGLIINLANMTTGCPGSGMCLGFYAGSYFHQMQYDNVNRIYTLGGNGLTGGGGGGGSPNYGAIMCSPVQNMAISVTYILAAYWVIYTTGKLNVYFATSATTGISHSYDTGGHPPIGQIMTISALRGAAGLNAIFPYYTSLSTFPTRNPSFSTFASSFN